MNRDEFDDQPGSRPSGPEKKSAARRVVFWGIVVFFTLIITPFVLVVTLGPTVAASLVPGAIRSASGEIDGTLDVDDVRLSWLGGAKLEGLRLVDTDGSLIARFDARTDRGILGLLKDPRDLGTLTLSGELNLEREDDGRFNIQRVFKVQPGAEGERGDSADWDYSVDEPGDGADVHIGGAEFNIPIDARLLAENIVVRIKDPELLTTTGGRFDSFEFDGVNIDLVASRDGSASGSVVLPYALDGGERATGKINLSIASDASQTVAFDAVFEGDLIDGSLKLTGSPDVVRLTEPGRVRVAPLLIGWITEAGGRARFETAPEVVLTADAFSLPFMNERPAWEQAALEASIDATASSGVAAFLPDADVSTPFATEPIALALSGTPAANGSPALLTIRGSGAATIDGRDAGRINAEVTAGGFTEGGSFVLPRTLSGEALLAGFATALAQPFLDPEAPELAGLLGPSVDVRLTTSEAGDDEPGFDVLAVLDSERASAELPLRLTEDRLSATGTLTARHRNLGMLIAAGAQLPDGLTFDDTGRATVEVSGFAIDLDPQTRRADLGSLTGDATVTVRSLVGSYTPGQATNASVRELVLNARAAPGERVVFDLGGELSVAAAPAPIEGRATIAPLGEWAGGPKPEGELTLSGVPTELASIAGERFGVLVPELAGRTADLRLALLTTDSGQAEVDVSATSDRSEITASAVMAGPLGAPTRVDLASAQAKLTLNDAGAAALLGAGSPAAVTLAEPGTVEVSIDPVSIPLDIDDRPALNATARVALAASSVLVTGKDGAQRELGPLDVDLEGSASAAQLGRGAVDARVSGSLASGAQRGTIAAELSNASAGDPMDARIEIDDVPTALAARLAGISESGALVALLGTDATVKLATTIDPEAGLPTRGSLTLEAPRMRTASPIEIGVDEGIARLTEPMTIQGVVTQDLLDALNSNRENSPARLIGEPTYTLTSDAFAVAIDGREPFTPETGPFDLRLRSPGITLRSQLVEGESEAILTDVALNIERAENFKNITFDLNAFGRDGTPESEISLTGVARDFCGESGDLRPALITVDAEASAPNLPIAIVDAFVGGNGVYQELLGPTAALEGDFRNLSRSGGTLDVSLISDRSTIRITGAVEDGLLSLSTDNLVTQRIITERLAQIVTRNFPALPRITKVAEQQPATVDTRDLQIPVDGGLSRLNGTVVIDPGVATIERSPRFASLFKLEQQRRFGEKLEPVTLSFDNGKMTIPRYTIPLGEFDIDIEGTHDLANDQLDLILWAPLGSLGDELAGELNLGIGGAIGSLGGLTLKEATMIPIRFKGTASSPSIQPDAQKLFQSLPERLIDDSLLEKGIKGIIKGIGGG